MANTLSNDSRRNSSLYQLSHTGWTTAEPVYKDISLEKGQHKKTPSKTAPATPGEQLFPIQVVTASLTFNIYCYLFSYLYISRITINNGTPYLKSPKNQNRRAASGQPAIKLLGRGVGALTSLRSTNPRPWFCLISSGKTILSKASHYKTRTNNH